MPVPSSRRAGPSAPEHHHAEDSTLHDAPLAHELSLDAQRAALRGKAVAELDISEPLAERVLACKTLWPLLLARAPAVASKLRQLREGLGRELADAMVAATPQVPLVLYLRRTFCNGCCALHARAACGPNTHLHPMLACNVFTN